MKLLRYYLVISISLWIVGCGSSDSTATEETALFTQADKDFLYRLFQTEYLWYDEIDETVDTSVFDTPQPMIDAIKSPRDRWSFAIDKYTYDDYTNQSYKGFGFVYDPETFRIIYTLLGSPAQNRLRRGDIILTVNGEPATVEVISTASTHLGRPSRFEVLRQGETITVEITPDVYTRKTVSTALVQTGNKNIGYMRYDAFSLDSYGEIEEAFSTFKQAGIDILVVDLRYNAGGSVTIASLLLDNLLGNHPGEVQFTLDWNINYKANNETYRFEDADEQDGNELIPTRLYFLTTRHTASASEAVISALYPYLGKQGVITIGTSTEGKNVGMQGRIFGDYYYFLINFYIKNAAGEISSAEGITPTCTAPDDLDHTLGDPDEAMLSTALYHISHGACP